MTAEQAIILNHIAEQLQDRGIKRDRKSPRATKSKGKATTRQADDDGSSDDMMTTTRKITAKGKNGKGKEKEKERPQKLDTSGGGGGKTNGMKRRREEESDEMSEFQERRPKPKLSTADNDLDR